MTTPALRALAATYCLVVCPAVAAASDPIWVGSRGVYVPQPVPRVEKSTPWYVRADVGYGVSSSGKMDITGFDTGISRSYGELDSSGLVSVGAGLRLTPSLRVEGQIDLRPFAKLGGRNKAVAKKSYWQKGEPFTTATGSQFETYDVTHFAVARTDDASAAHQNIMLYGFWDIPTGSVITPYLGAGIGINVRSMRRDMKDAYDCTGTVNQYHDGTKLVERPLSVCKMADFTEKNRESSMQIGLAAAAAAGFGVSLGAGTTLDFGYRLMWQSADSQLSWRRLDLFPESTIRFSDRLDHEIRTGLRFSFD